MERGVHSWTISIGFSRPTIGSGTYLPQSHRWICRTVSVMSMMLSRTRVPVQMTTTAVESLCLPVVIQTRSKEGCDPASSRRLRRGRDVLMKDSVVAVDTRRISIAPDTDFLF